jgi:hypothetical protein
MGGLAILMHELNSWTASDWLWLIAIIIVILVTTTGSVIFILRAFKKIRLDIGKNGIKVNAEEVADIITDAQKKLFEEQLLSLRNENDALNRANSNLHFMDEENRGHDDHLKQRCQERTASMRIRLQNGLIPVISNKLAVIAICVNIRATFSNAIIRNHFTKELMPDRLAFYKARIFDEITQEYTRIALENEDVPVFGEMSNMLETFVKDWLRMMTAETSITCEEKIRTYKEYLTRFNRVPHIQEIVNTCVEKNEEYIRKMATMNFA